MWGENKIEIFLMGWKAHNSTTIWSFSIFFVHFNSTNWDFHFCTNLNFGLFFLWLKRVYSKTAFWFNFFFSNIMSTKTHHWFFLCHICFLSFFFFLFNVLFNFHLNYFFKATISFFFVYISNTDFFLFISFFSFVHFYFFLLIFYV